MSQLVDFKPMENEIWSKVPSLPPHIEVSTLGRIRQYITSTVFKELVPNENSGYLSFSYGGETYFVHRVIASTFIEIPEYLKDVSRLVVNHKNGIKIDNRVDNLEWATNTDNLLKSYSWGTACRQKIYCKELDRVFGSLRTAAFLTQLPQDVISRSIQENIPICGLTFVKVEAYDSMLDKRNVFYIDFDRMFELASKAQSREDLLAMLDLELGDGIPCVDTRVSC